MSPGTAPLRLEPADRAEWRRWLEANGETSKGIWLVISKKVAAGVGIQYEEAVEEALCFGWIDSKVRRLDERRFEQWYSPRRPGGIWSQPNKQRIARLEAAGLVAPPGRARIAAARVDGSWEILDRVDALEIPDDLAAAFAAAPRAAAGFAAMAPSIQKQYLYWVLSAKRAQTRAARLAAVVSAAVEGRALFPSE